MTSSIYDAAYWFGRAAKMRARAGGINNAESARSLLQIADEYERAGRIAEQHTPKGPTPSIAPSDDIG